MDKLQISAKAVFDHAVEIELPEDREAYVNEACAEDGNLKRKVNGLLKAHEEAGSFLKSPLPGVEATIDSDISEGPGAVIGPYKLLQKIGEGGMGVVYMAEQTRPVKMRVALKIIKPGMDSKQVIARFETERQALALMEHPNIAKVLAAGTTESGRPYFAMELVKGKPITTYCDKYHLTLRERLKLIASVCAAVQHAHQKGIIHRDLKPSNVLVARYDGKPVAKVIDFGVAKATGQQLTDKTLFTQYGQVVGTLEYMSPEQAEFNQQDVDTRSDIYSLGIILYQLVTGTTPFDPERLRSGAWNEVMKIIREEEPPRPSVRLSSAEGTPSITADNCGTEPGKLLALLRGDLDWLVMKALAKERERRYETASALAADIERYLDGDAIEARPPSTVYRLRKTAARHRVALATAAVVMLALVGGMATTTWQRHLAIAAADELRLTLRELSESLFHQGVADVFGDNRERAETCVTRLQDINDSRANLFAEELNALIVVQNDNPKKAVSELEKSVNHNPHCVALRALLTIAYDHAGDTDKLFESSSILSSMTPVTAEDYLFAGKALILEPKRGAEYCRIAFEKRKSPMALLWRGRSLADYAMVAGKPELLEQALRDVDAASWYLGRHGFVPATRLATYVLAAHTCRAAKGPEWERYLAEANDVVKYLCAKDSLSPWERLYLSEYYSLQEDLDAAWRLYDDVPNDSWTDFHTNHYLALAASVGKRGDQEFLTRIERDPPGPFSETGRAFTLAIDGDIRQAVGIANGMIGRYESLNSVLLAIDSMLVAGEAEAARNVARENLDRWRNRDVDVVSTWLFRILRFYAGDGDIGEQELIQYANSADDRSFDLGRAHWVIALSHLSKNELDEAELHFQKSLAQRQLYGRHYWWSRALLTQIEEVDSWPPRREPVD